MTRTWMTPPEASIELRCRTSKVIGWIRSGRLRAVNLSEGQRPRYRISRDALDEFLAAMAVVPEGRPARRQRREIAESFV
jgi:excisionase family DNA binding protein